MKNSSERKAANVILSVLAALTLGFLLFQYVFHVDLIGMVTAFSNAHGLARPVLSEGVGLGVVFLYGLLSSIHCVGMCGGLVLSVTSAGEKRSRILENVKYQSARLVSYALVGLLLGAVGSALSLSKTVQAYVPIFSGILMLVMGLSLLLGQTTLSVPKWYGKILGKFYKSNAFVMGLLNALLPCGTMQAAQLYAVGTGSPVQGMLAMFVFAAGTIPLLFLFGLMSAVFEDRNWKWVLPVSALLVLFLGIQMLLKGLSLI